MLMQSSPLSGAKRQAFQNAPIQFQSGNAAQQGAPADRFAASPKVNESGASVSSFSRTFTRYSSDR